MSGAGVGMMLVFACCVESVWVPPVLVFKVVIGIVDYLEVYRGFFLGYLEGRVVFIRVVDKR